MLRKTNTDQNSILFSHLTPNSQDINHIFQNDFSDIIEEQTIPGIPRESYLMNKQRQIQIRNNSPEIKEGVSQIGFFKSDKCLTTQNFDEFIFTLDNQNGTQQDVKQSPKPKNMTPTNVTIREEQEKSLFGIPMFSEEQPLQNQQQSAATQKSSSPLQNRKHISQIQQESKGQLKKSSVGKRTSSNENNSPFMNQLHQSIQLGVISDNQMLNISNNLSPNVVNNRLSNPKSQVGVASTTTVAGKIAKYNNLLKQFVQKKKFGAQKQKEQNSSLNPDQLGLNPQSSIVKLKVKIQNIVVRAVKKWKEYSNSWVFSQLNESAYKIIGDKAHMTAHELCYSENSMSSSISKRNNIIQQTMMVLYNKNKIKMQSLFYKIIKWWKQIKTIDPSSTILLYWDILHILCIVFNIYYLILEWVTDMNFTTFYGLPWIISIISSFTIFSIDIFLNFHKGFYHEGVCIYDKHRISSFYLAKNFFFDFCAIIPLVISISEVKGELKLLTVLIIFKIQTAIYILSKYKDLYSSRSSSSYTSPIIYLIKLGLTILFVAHIFASFFLGLAIYIQRTESNYNTWLMQRQISHEPWLIQYTFSLYWAVCTMTTVGYGDITPQNPYEAAYVIVTMFIACGFFGYTFNSIGSMVQEIQNRNREFNEQMKVVNLFLQNNDISNDLKLRIRKYFEFRRNSKKDISKKEENEILEQLDDDLKDLVTSEVGVQKYKKIKEITKIFDPFSDKIKKKLHEISEEIVIRGDDYKYFIVQANQIQEYYDLFIVLSGKAKIYMKNDQEESHDISGGGGNNEMQKSEMIFNEKKENKVNKSQINPLYILESKSVFGEQSFFTKLIKENQSDYELFCQIRDNIILNQNFKTIGSSCLACNKTGHDITKCKYVHYNVDKSQFIYKKLLTDKYEIQNLPSKPIFFERRRAQKLKYTKYIKYNSTLTNQMQNQGSLTPQTKRNSTFKQASFKTFSNLTTIIPNNPEDKPDLREQVNLEESDHIYEFKFYYPEGNIQCIIWKMILQNLKKRKSIEQFQQQSDISCAYTNKANLKSNNSLFNHLLNKPKNSLLKPIPHHSNLRLNPILEIISSVQNSSRKIDKPNFNDHNLKYQIN